MKLSTQPYKGARDFYPEDKRVQTYLFTVIEEAVSAFGYEEYDAPILEPLEIYLAKTGTEIVNEQTYNFTDRGGRNVVIRPEMTPTVSRMVAGRRQELAYPLRWYSIPNLWRYERPQRGRLREHWQLNVDLFGVAGIEAEVEMLQVVQRIFQGFGATDDMYEIRLNSRVLMDYLLSTELALNAEQSLQVAKLIDRIHKLPPETFRAQLKEIIADDTAVERFSDLLVTTDISSLPESIKELPATKRLTQMLDDLKAVGIVNARFDITVMRGFDYYTDIVFEVFDTHPDNNRSMMGGGRYDGLVGLFGVPPIPTVGFGLGDATLLNFVQIHNLLPEIKNPVQLYVVLIGDVSIASQSVMKTLRDQGVRIAVDYTGRKLGDQLKTADKKGIPYALIIGDEELRTGNLKVRNLITATEQTAQIADVAAIVKE